jgi:hypothetical protein
LSVAVNEVIGISRLVEGDVAVNAVTVGMPASPVVYEKESAAAIALPFASVTAVDMFTVYDVVLA